MLVHVLLYETGKDSEGIHSLELNGGTVVLMFEEKDDAERYSGLLEAQDFPSPSVEVIDSGEIEHFCSEAGYEARLVPKGFIPTNEEDRLLIVPPETNLEVNNLDEDVLASDKYDSEESNHDIDIDKIKRSLENLL